MKRGWTGSALLAVGAMALSACGGSDGSDGAAGASEPAGDGAATPATAPSAPAETAPSAPPKPNPKPKALAGLPADTAGFTAWPRLNDRPIPPDSVESQRVGFDAHRSTKQVHLNPRAARRQDGRPFPDGSVIVKAGREDGVITLIAIMRKVAGADPGHGDWRFREWKRASASEPFTTSDSLAGATCWSCHAIAQPSDWVFTAATP